MFECPSFQCRLICTTREQGICMLRSPEGSLGFLYLRRLFIPTPKFICPFIGVGKMKGIIYVSNYACKMQQRCRKSRQYVYPFIPLLKTYCGDTLKRYLSRAAGSSDKHIIFHKILSFYVFLLGLKKKHSFLKMAFARCYMKFMMISSRSIVLCKKVT